jgi:hypothetical protein
MSAPNLAAIAIFSRNDNNLSKMLDIHRSVDFYSRWNGSDTSSIKPWISGKIPEKLLVVVDKGRFQLRLPWLFPNSKVSFPSIDNWVFRNVFLHEGKAYWKGTVVQYVEMQC